MIDFKKKIEEDEQQGERVAPSNNQNNLLLNRRNKRISTYTIVIIVLVIIFAGRVLMSSISANDWFNNEIFNNFKHLIPSTDRSLAGEKNDRINVLLLGIGGPGHDGSYLTDTIILLSLKPSSRQVSLISIPRDLVTPVNNWEKINTIDAYAEVKYPGQGGKITAQTIGKLLHIPIQYYARVDFGGFVKIINQLGGIRVNVVNTLDDYQYPIIGQEKNPDYAARYEHLHISKGPQSMDGSVALEYVRSRHAAGIEGSDFARARRQQLILEAVRNKLFSAQTLLNPIIITKVIKELNKNVSTNLNVWEILKIWNLFKNVNHKQIITKVLSNAPNNFLVAGVGQNGAYVLTPRSGNFKNIVNFVQNIFSTNLNTSSLTGPTISDQASVVVLNGTWISGLASKNAVLLEQAKFKVLNITNALSRDNRQTTVYDLTYGKRKKSLAILEKITGARESFQQPAWLSKYKKEATTTNIININSSTPQKINSQQVNIYPNFVVVLGTSADQAK